MSLLYDPTFMALSPIEMIEYLQRLNMSEPHPNPERANVLSDLHRMLEDNAPISHVVVLMLVGILRDIQEEQQGNNGISGSRLSTQKILRHPQVSVRDDKMDGECTICMHEYEKDERIGTLDCRHEFHADCVKDWLLRKNECPLCRATGLKI